MHQTSDLIPSTDRIETERKERGGGERESERKREDICQAW
jgi:hypothetical protein